MSVNNCEWSVMTHRYWVTPHKIVSPRPLTARDLCFHGVGCLLRCFGEIRWLHFQGNWNWSNLIHQKHEMNLSKWWKNTKHQHANNNKVLWDSRVNSVRAVIKLQAGSPTSRVPKNRASTTVRGKICSILQMVNIGSTAHCGLFSWSLKGPGAWS
jgi:hypothetical protein